jgi:LysR family transcriptional regulator, benzoate and cis,cis-muconate-responsive activator of ben and cat genes
MVNHSPPDHAPQAEGGIVRYLVDAELLQSFMAVAEELNFRRAAERLHIDQSALTRRIQKLEARIGFELFSRSTREVRLTEAGHSFHHDNLQTLAKLQEAVVRARRVAEGQVRHLRIGYMSFAAIEVMPRAVRAFRYAYPEVSFEITYIDTQGQKLALARNEIDVSFMIGPFAHHDFATLSVSADRLLAVLPKTHWLVTRPQLFLRDLAEGELILGDPVWWDFYRLVITDLFSAQGLTPRAKLQASSTLGILGLVAAGVGVSLYPEVVRLFQPRGVAIREIDDCDQRIETVLAWRKDHSNAAVARFVKCCEREFAGVLARRP